MATYYTVVKEVCQKEIENGCYDVIIDGVDIFNYVKRTFRNKVLALNGIGEKESFNPQSKWTKIKSILISFCQITRLYCTKKHFDNIIYSFRRVDKVDGIYVDKFTDPLIDNSIVGSSYIVLEAGREGLHAQPRCHADHIIYVDFINAFAIICSRLFLPIFKKKNQKVLVQLFKTTDKAYPDIKYCKEEVVKEIYYGMLKTRIYRSLFKRKGCERFFAPSRSDFQVMIPAARKNNMSVFELQHGITYAESLTYSGFRSYMFTPDKFLAFGEMAPKNVYGIEEEKIHNIGFAFLDFVKDCVSSKKMKEGGVLLISEPSVSEKMITVILRLASKYPDITFSFRPHPMEILTREQLGLLNSQSNVVLDDNTQNIMVSLTQYKHVIGENSTVLYEALSNGNIVGKLSMEGLMPKYLEESDKRYFFEINNENDFDEFYKEAKGNENVKHIYSPYSHEKFEELIKINSHE